MKCAALRTNPCPSAIVVADAPGIRKRKIGSMIFEVFSAEKYEVEKPKIMSAHASTGIQLVHDRSIDSREFTATAPLMPGFLS